MWAVHLKDWRDHVKPTLRLALPVTLARLGALVLVTVDAAMSGHAGGNELAYYGLASSPYVPLLLVGIGLLLGVVILTAHAEGSGKPERCGAVWRVGLIHAAVYGVVLGGACYWGEEFLMATGQSADLAAGAGRTLNVLGWGLPGMLLYIATIFFLEGIHRPVPGMIAMIIGNLLNAALNWIFIYGHWGSPAMGAEGAALATTIVRWLLFALVLAYVLFQLDRRHYGITLSPDGLLSIGSRLRRVGYPMALGHGLESAAFSTIVLFAGLLGATQVAAYTIVQNLVALIFMVALGFGTAASVRVANAVARNNVEEMRVAGWVAAGLAFAFLATFSLAFASFPRLLAEIFSADPTVVAFAVPPIMIAALALVPDGLQAVLVGALRGMSDVWPATGILLVSFWLVMVPVGYVTGVLFEGGAPMLILSVVIATVFAAALLGLRFKHRCDIAREATASVWRPVPSVSDRARS